MRKNEKMETKTTRRPRPTFSASARPSALCARTPPHTHTMADPDPSEALLAASSPYVGSDARPKRDSGWKNALAVFAALSLFGGVAAAFGW